MKCQDFNLRADIRKQLIGFFDSMKAQIEKMQKQKMDEFNKLIKDTNVINIKQRAKEVTLRTDACE
jgi:formamidopyrimidine-DNA glycosylase